jgi:acetyl esterase/lipase
MKKKRSLMMRLLIWSGAGLTIVAAVAAAFYWYWFQAPSQLTADIQYSTRDNKPLMLDVFQPPKPNGAGVVFMVSGGYTVFAVRHISQPECTIGDLTADVIRSVRFVRLHAKEYGVDSNRLGVIGGSSGGHLSLMIGTTGGPGDPNSTDEVERESSAVQCVACFYPPTDLLNLKGSTEFVGEDEPPKSFKKGFGPLAESKDTWKVLGRELSPIYHITPQMPPTFIVHGEADTLVPIDQSERFIAEAKAQGCTVKFETRPEKGHGWPTMVFDIIKFADWFDQHLGAK